MPSSSVEVETDDAVARFGERRLGPSTLVHGQRGVRHERLGTSVAQALGEGLHGASGVSEHEPLLASVQRGDDCRRIGDGADVVQLQLRRGDIRRDDDGGSVARAAALQPGEQPGRIADCRRQSALQRTSHQV